MITSQAVQQAESQNQKQIDTALVCLVTVAKLLGIPADEEQLRRAYVMGGASMDTTSLVRAAKELGLKSRLVDTKPEKLMKTPLPAIAILKNGNFIVVLKTDGAKLLLFDPYRERPLTLPVENFVKAWNGQMVLITKRFSLKDASSQFNFTWFIPVVLKFKRFFGEVILASFFLQLFGLVSPLFTQVIIDKVLVHRGVSTLDILALGLLLIGLFEAWMGILRTYLFSHTTNKVDVILGTKLFRHIAALPLKYFELRRVGDTVARVRELENIRQFITGSALTVVLDTFFTIVFIVVMFYYSPTLSVIALASLPVYVALSVITTPMYKERLNERFAAGAESQAYLVETITGIQTVKSMALEPQFNHKWEQLLARYVKTSFDTANLSNIAGNIGRLIQKVSSLAILWFGAHMVMDGRLTIGQLIAFQMLSGQVSAPVLRLVNLWQSFQQTKLSIERLGDILNSPPEPAFNPNRTTLPSIKGEVVLDRVTFRYRPETSEVLHQISLHINPGSRVGIVGRSGSGKSTLTKLIQRLYVPETGRILIDGVDLAQVEPAWLRRQIGVVLQENFLFNGSVRDNIAVARPGAAMDEVVRVAEMAGAHEFILELPEGYDTNVGERGALLSGGQRQRVAIARALLTNPRLLIFDEATSALDYESERIIQKNLDQICTDRTVIMIAHRLTTVRQCDVIFVLDRGKIIEQGSHEELIRLKGLYHNLHAQQEG
jgi:ATP-binding cassette, subfamily B, bacterial HlyB/CyaB